VKKIPHFLVEIYKFSHKVLFVEKCVIFKNNKNKKCMVRKFLNLNAKNEMQNIIQQSLKWNAGFNSYFNMPIK